MEDQEKKTSEISLGTLYDFNKTAVLKEKDLTRQKLRIKKETLITDYLKEMNNKYYMMLCREQNDYTIFHLTNESDEKIKELTDVLVDECLLNRGSVKGIDLTEDKQALEIWLKIDDEVYVYYFFPYDAALVEV